MNQTRILVSHFTLRLTSEQADWVSMQDAVSRSEYVRNLITADMAKQQQSKPQDQQGAR
jgi:hypothetical protein